MEKEQKIRKKYTKNRNRGIYLHLGATVKIQNVADQELLLSEKQAIRHALNVQFVTRFSLERS